MTRSERLLELLQLLRSYKNPVSAKKLAAKLDVSVRSIYRDIDTLNAQGANIQGAAGLGYVLHDGYMLPPLMFTQDEIEALVLGSRWVESHADTTLSQAAESALTKVRSVLPSSLAKQLDETMLMPRKCSTTNANNAHASSIRCAMRKQRKVQLNYQGGDGNITDRIIWPFALGFFEETQILAAWCELREDFRHFRIDRMIHTTILENQPYPTHKNALFKQWRLEDKNTNATDKN